MSAPVAPQQVNSAINTALSLAFLLLLILVRTIVATKLWSWFIVPGFSAPHLTYAQMAGALTLLSLLRYRTGAPGGKNNLPALDAIFTAIASDLFYFAIGWLVMVST